GDDRVGPARDVGRTIGVGAADAVVLPAKPGARVRALLFTEGTPGARIGRRRRIAGDAEILDTPAGAVEHLRAAVVGRRRIAAERIGLRALRDRPHGRRGQTPHVEHPDDEIAGIAVVVEVAAAGVAAARLGAALVTLRGEILHGV